MLSFFRRGPTPAIHEPLPPPPSRAARIEKEKRWYDSISGKGGKAEVDKGRAVDNERETTKERKLRSKTSSASLRSSATRQSSFFSNPLLGKSSPHLLPSSSLDPALHLGVNGVPRSTAPSTKSRGSTFFRSRKTTADDSSGLILPSPRTSYAASAPPPRTKKDSSFATAPPPLPHQLSTSQADVSTQYLATRLQELAVANSDGLLDDEDYRMLRTQLFERYAKAGPGASGTGEMLGEGNEEVPILHGRDRTPPSSVIVPPTPSRVAALANTSGPGRSPSFLSTASRAKSTTAISSLFRRNTSSTRSGKQPIDEDWDVVQPNRVDVSSILSGKTGRSRASIIPTEEHSVFRARSVRNHPAFTSSALSSRGGEGSSRSSNGGRGGTSVYSTEGSTHYGARSSLSHSPSRTRGTTVHSSRSRLDSVSYSSPSLPLPPLASSTDPFIFASSDREPNSSELKAEIRDIESEWGRLGELWDGLEKAAVEKWEERIGPGGLAMMENAIGRNALRVFGGEVAANGVASTRKKSLMRKASLTLSKRSPPATPSAWTFDLPSALEQPNPVGLSEDAERATQALRDELEEVRRRRRATEGKYEQRLEYLRARLKGAIIREGLPR